MEDIAFNTNFLWNACTSKVSFVIICSRDYVKPIFFLLTLEVWQLSIYVLSTTMKPQWGNNWNALSREWWRSHVLQSKYHLGRLPDWRDLPALGLGRSRNPQLWGSTLGAAKWKAPVLSAICSIRHISSSVFWPSRLSQREARGGGRGRGRGRGGEREGEGRGREGDTTHKTL